MNWFRRCGLVGLLVGAGMAVGQQPAEENPLQQLNWMTGGMWVGEIKAPDGKVTVIESTITWSEHRRVIKFSTHFKSEGKDIPRYEGMYAWHPGKKKLAFWYSDNEGNFTEGTTVAQGNTMQQDFEITHTNGETETFRSFIRRDGADAYDMRVEGKSSGEWKEMFRLRYTRKYPVKEAAANPDASFRGLLSKKSGGAQ